VATWVPGRLSAGDSILTAWSYSFILVAMKVAVSVPDRVFEEAEEIAKRLRLPRSRVYARALEEFVKKHRGKSVRDALDAVYGNVSSGLDPLLTDLQAHALREKW
jgi:metal-responsive CopG/Arc/MetJ family transcriptional regulator